LRRCRRLRRMRSSFLKKGKSKVVWFEFFFSAITL
jgi:hypothetical protein